MALDPDEEKELATVRAEKAQLLAAPASAAPLSDRGVSFDAPLSVKLADPARGVSLPPLAVNPNPAAELPPSGLSPDEEKELAAVRAEKAQLLAAPASAADPPPVSLSGAADEAPPERPDGHMAALWEYLHPQKTRNDALEQLPDWITMPELHHFSKNSALSLFGTMAAGPEDTKKILEKQYPGIDIKQDGRYLVITSPEDGQKYAWKPGIRWSDLERAGAAAATTAGAAALGTLAAPAALTAALPTAGGVAAGILGGAGGNALLEGLKYAAGGDFSKGNVAAGAVLGGLIPGVGNLGRSAYRQFSGQAAADAAAAAAAIPASEAASPEALKALGATMAQAGRGSASAAENVASQARPDPEVMAAATRQGLVPDLSPAHVSTNGAFQELSQALPGADAAYERAMKSLGANLDRSLKSLGGRADQSVADEAAKAAVAEQLAAAKSLPKRLYDEVGEVIPKETPTPISNLNARIDQIAARRKGTIPELVQQLRDKLGSDPTWDMVDAETKNLGAATKNKGAYKNLEPGMAPALREALDADRQAIAEKFGVGDKFRLAQDAFKHNIALQKQAVSVLGQQGAKSLAAQVEGKMKALAYGSPDSFERVMSISPRDARPDIAKNALFTFIKDGKLDVPNFVDWFKGLKNNERSYNALMTYLGPEVREKLQDSYTVAKAVSDAMSKRGPNAATAFPEPTGLVNKLFKTFLTAQVPVPDFAKYTLIERIFGRRTPVQDAVDAFIKSPAGRVAMEASASNAPFKPGLIRNVAGSLQYNNLMDAANIRASERIPWLEEALQRGAHQTVQQAKENSK